MTILVIVSLNILVFIIFVILVLLCLVFVSSVFQIAILETHFVTNVVLMMLMLYT